MKPTRKKWRAVMWPGGQAKAFQSKSAAYRAVVSLAADRGMGMTRANLVVVFVDEGQGKGWERYERINLDEITASLAAGVSREATP